MQVIAGNTHLLSLLDEVSNALLTTDQGDSHRVVAINRLLHRWHLLHSVTELARHQTCLLESLALAACRGLSGEAADLTRSLLSLQINVSYYRNRVTAWK
ncbi:hypothetical protein [Pseudomonas serbica]|uniref:hypothetical protein n=1 Tax=Pseudomonas serbica TaxID=2965074 RepID=UPI00237C248D|nr:hypothetical protein [Pseudomonas serbica]